MGFSSWKTSDTEESIPCRFSTPRARPVYLLQPEGKPPFLEKNYEGYCSFGGINVFVWLALNNLDVDGIAFIKDSEDMYSTAEALGLGLDSYVYMDNNGKYHASTNETHAFLINKFGLNPFKNYILEDGSSLEEKLDKKEWRAVHFSNLMDNYNPLKFSFNHDAKYEHLPASMPCDSQGFNYSENEAAKIIESVEFFYLMNPGEVESLGKHRNPVDVIALWEEEKIAKDNFLYELGENIISSVLDNENALDMKKVISLHNKYENAETRSAIGELFVDITGYSLNTAISENTSIKRDFHETFDITLSEDEIGELRSAIYSYVESDDEPPTKIAERISRKLKEPSNEEKNPLEDVFCAIVGEEYSKLVLKTEYGEFLLREEESRIEQNEEPASTLKIGGRK